MTAQQHQRSVDSTNCEIQIAASMLVLFKPCCPPYIFNCVIPVIVRIAIEGLSRWSLSHISQKVREAFRGLKPSLANLYPPASVAIVAFVFGICAACNHVPPAIVGFAFPGASCMSVGGNIISPLTLAGIPLPGEQSNVSHCPDSLAESALDFDLANLFAPSRNRSGCIFKDDVDSKLPSDDVYFGRHNNGSSVVVFSGAGQHQLTFTAPHLNFLQQSPST